MMEYYSDTTDEGTLWYHLMKYDSDTTDEGPHHPYQLTNNATIWRQFYYTWKFNSNYNNIFPRSLKIQSKPKLVQIHTLVETSEISTCARKPPSNLLVSKLQPLALLQLYPRSKCKLPHIRRFVYTLTSPPQSCCKLPHIRRFVHRLRKTHSSLLPSLSHLEAFQAFQASPSTTFTFSSFPSKASTSWASPSRASTSQAWLKMLICLA